MRHIDKYYSFCYRALSAPNGAPSYIYLVDKANNMLITTDQTISEYYKVPIYLSNNSGQVRKANYSLEYTGQNPNYLI